LREAFATAGSAAVPVARLLRATAEAANRQILERVEQEPALKGMGATCTVLHLGKDQATFVQVADSRFYYLARDGATGTRYMERLTRDQTVNQMLIEPGSLSQEEADSRGSPLLQAVGRERLRPDMYIVHRARAEAWLLCSDGLSDVAPECGMGAALLDRSRPAEAVCEFLTARANELGSPDNITVIKAREPDLDGGRSGRQNQS